MIGRIVSHYRIVSQLGAGAMGEVYLAEDLTLGRRVALKILPVAVALDRERAERFVLEARAASAMNHANIASVHELGESGNLRFIAMEYVEGKPLDVLLSEGPLEPLAAVDIARQVAAALGEAHAKGITHRDIKPANIMLTPRGVVKVLDFGIAKLRPDVNGLGDSSNAATIATTNPGLVLGTVYYMSPEQALAADVDARSDIFALGVVLYELLTGRRPFEAHSSTATIDEILHLDPPAPSAVRPDLPPTFDRVVARALAKSLTDRYQTAAELAADLDALSEGAEPVGAPVRRKPFLSSGRLLAIAAAAILIVAPTIFYFGTDSARVTGTVAPLTTLPGAETRPAFSPDGTTVAYSWSGPQEDNIDIYLQPANTGITEPKRLTRDPAADTHPMFSPDGKFVAFARAGSRLMIVPREGGAERDLGKIEQPPLFSFTHDGRAIVFGGSGNPGPSAAGIRLLPLDGGPLVQLTRPPEGQSDLEPRFSPDNTLLAFIRTPVSSVSDLYVMPVGGGDPRRLTSDDRGIEGFAWSKDGRDIIFSSARAGWGRLWRVSRDGGAPTLVTESPPQSTNPALDPVGDRLAFNVSTLDTNVWSLPLDAAGLPAGPATRLIASTVQDTSPDVSPDGGLVAFASNRTGRDAIWVVAIDGTAPREIWPTSDTGTSVVGSPRWSPDGSRIAFDARVKGNADIYVVEARGGAWVRLTTHAAADVVPTWSGDGKWIYFTSRRTGPPEVWRIASSGGSEERVTHNIGFAAQESPDRTMLYYLKARDRSLLFARPLAGGAETPLLVDPKGIQHRVVQFACWRPTAHGILFVEELADTPQTPANRRTHAIQRLRTDGVLETLFTMTRFAPVGAAGLALSPDGRRLLFTQIDEESSDLFLLQPFR